jgi:CDP-diacylglycerol--glycerol-3-phosphate 3-phosphatidyltransferase
MRVLIAPVFAWVFIHAVDARDGLVINIGGVWICFALAALVELSDLFDGMIARARHEVTDLGKVFDPIADSVSRQTMFIAFMVAGIIPWWLYLVFFYRDAFMQLLRIICASGGFVLAARPSGKLKAVLQGVGSFGVLLVVALQSYGLVPETLWGRHPGFWVMVLPAAYTLLTLVDYILPNRGMIAKMMAPE